MLDLNNIDEWLERWAAWCLAGNIRLPGMTSNALVNKDKVKQRSFVDWSVDDVEFAIEQAVASLAKVDVLAAEALRLDVRSSIRQSERALIIKCSLSTYKRKVKKAKLVVIDEVNRKCF
ncbi:hypothetical protein J7384_17900 [Endozoicomonas sp. G2_1]|uniref:hypothetical protein n=1 Tax=Endozoicomonas sp. G2_1 TaxID=2821091 RepID=UPI001ADA10AC|nr:hypothetical protein [Endozoicomonas sp. G2_1]MBO9492240.1 hypothetical protein [Endozoicomonas sp. G2_1]